MDSLSTRISVKALKKAIENMPDLLYQLYDDALERINSQNKDDRVLAYKALSWVAYAYQPLTLHMLEEALAIDHKVRDFDPEAIPQVGLVLDLCAGLLIVDEQTNVVRLVHYTAQDYFDTLLDSRFEDAHASIAEDCIVYLSYDTIQFPIKGDNYRYYFLSYAARFWALHQSAAKGQRQANLEDQIGLFLSRSPRVWLKKYAPHFPVTPAQLQECNGVGIAAYFGLCNALRRSLSDTKDVNILTYGGQLSALHLAARNDQALAAEILLKHGAYIECIDAAGETPLMHATKTGSATAVQALVDKGANVLTTNRYGDKLLAVVIEPNAIPLLQSLFKAGADINSVNVYGETQLMQRIQNQDVQTIKWLLSKGASVNIRNRHGETALHYALWRRWTDLVEILMSYGIDPRICDRHHNSYLHTACLWDYSTVMTPLLNQGVNVDSVNFDGDTALHVAARAGASICSEILLANDANIDVQNKQGRTPLMEAVEYRSYKIIYGLLKADVNVNCQNNYGTTALHLAAAQSDAPAIQEMVENHAVVPQRSIATSAFLHSPNFIPRGLADFVVPILIDQTEMEVSVFVPRRLKGWRLSWLLRKMHAENGILGLRLWETGLTALDIASLRGDPECIRLLEPLMGPRTKSYVMPFEKYLAEVFEFRSDPKVEKVLKEYGIDVKASEGTISD
ncbi:MAG: hypothetical protein Q9225_005340 [Loekoesia sp. 1 TL-2023]